MALLPRKQICVEIFTLSTCIDKQILEMLTNLKTKFGDLDYVCTIADIQVTTHKSHFDITAYWLNDDLSQGSAAIACQRFKGTHDYSSCADHVYKIHKTYGLFNTKIVKLQQTITVISRKLSWKFDTLSATLTLCLTVMMIIGISKVKTIPQ